MSWNTTKLFTSMSWHSFLPSNYVLALISSLNPQYLAPLHWLQSQLNNFFGSFQESNDNERTSKLLKLSKTRNRHGGDLNKIIIFLLFSFDFLISSVLFLLPSLLPLHFYSSLSSSQSWSITCSFTGNVGMHQNHLISANHQNSRCEFKPFKHIISLNRGLQEIICHLSFLDIK